MNGRMIDVAFAQTARAGHPYLVCPLPWWHEWQNMVWLLCFANAESELAFRWWDFCGLPGYDFDKCVVLDGDIYFCLLKPHHEGPCGYDKVAFEVLTLGRSGITR